MNVIFVTIAFPRSDSESNLYTDLMEEFAEHGHKVHVVCASEKRFSLGTILSESNGIKVLRVETGNITSNPNYIAKGLALLQLQSLFISAIENHFPQIAFDLILYSTPPIQYNRIIKHLKRKSKASTYLLLKDIFPQNAIDIGLFRKWNPVYWHFRHQEKETYRLSDRIGCMSPANVKYLLANNADIKPEKVEVCANSLKDRGIKSESDRMAIRSKIRKSFLIREDELVLIYGGNLGVSQGIPFFLDILGKYHTNQKIKFLIVGEGTWYGRIEKSIVEENYQNVILQKRVQPDQFKEMLLASDVGLIFLDPRFTIPNFPSRLTSYLEVGLPVIACTDKVSDVGDIVEKGKCGYKIISGDIGGFNEAIQKLTESTNTLRQKSSNARMLFERSYTTGKSYNTIMNALLN